MHQTNEVKKRGMVEWPSIYFCWIHYLQQTNPLLVHMHPDICPLWGRERHDNKTVLYKYSWWYSTILWLPWYGGCIAQCNCFSEIQA